MSDWSSDVCSSDLVRGGMTPYEVLRAATINGAYGLGMESDLGSLEVGKIADLLILGKNPLEDIRNTLTIESVMKDGVLRRSEEHTSELQSLMRISYAVFCLKKKTQQKNYTRDTHTHNNTTT